MYPVPLTPILDIDFDEDGFASCEEDEEVIKTRSAQKDTSNSSQELGEEFKGEGQKLEYSKEGPTGDILNDYYLDLDQITDEEELKYIKIGREAVHHLLKELPLEKVWTLYKQTKGCEMFIKKGGSPYSCFRVNVEFDFPPALVLEHCKDIPKRMSWDEGYE
jgi:hypothetical protein